MKKVSKIRTPGFSRSWQAQHGLSLPSSVLKALQKRGIYCVPGVSLEHQYLGGCYLLRGIESGGSVSDMGRACAFIAPDGTPVPWLQSIFSLSVNGRHAIILAERLVRVEMLRSFRSYELAITLHSLSYIQGRKRPEIATKLLFRGRDGVLSFDLWKQQHRSIRGELTPTFYDRAGEVLRPPQPFESAIRQLTTAVCCIGCKHTHVSVPPHIGEESSMLTPKRNAITVGEPNWAPLEATVPAMELENFMYMGCAGEIELYKHRLTRRYLSVGRGSHNFYQYVDGEYVEITREAALERVFG